jgi:NAD(P)-dependent dehydrogenase (short-subunit alcohol dehydrogenase family)
MSNSPNDLAGKTVFITGASSGLGRHFAMVLAKAGASVALAARRMDHLEALAAELQTVGVRTLSIPMDVTSEGSVVDAVALAAREFGGLDVLINNAGVTISKPIVEQTESDWDYVLDTNLKGAFLVGREFARCLRDAKRAGAVINIASILGLRQCSQVTPYAASKAGLIQLTKQMALEWARDRIRVNAIAPGYIETDLNREFFATAAGLATIKGIPQRRLGRADDLDGPLLLLASDASRYMTGAVLVVDGGHTLRSV